MSRAFLPVEAAAVPQNGLTSDDSQPERNLFCLNWITVSFRLYNCLVHDRELLG
jgi:hypothetical protein